MSGFWPRLVRSFRRSLWGASAYDLLEEKVEGARFQLESFRALTASSRQVIGDLEAVLAQRLEALSDEPRVPEKGKASGDSGGEETNDRQVVFAQLDVKDLREELLEQAKILSVLVAQMGEYERALARAERALGKAAASEDPGSER